MLVAIQVGEDMNLHGSAIILAQYCRNHHKRSVEKALQPTFGSLVIW